MYCGAIYATWRQLQIRLTKARPSFYLMKKTADSETILKFLDAKMLVILAHHNSSILFDQTMALIKWVLVRYNITRVDLQVVYILGRIEIPVYRQCRAGTPP